MLSPFRTRLATGVALGLVLLLWPAAWRIAAPACSPFLSVCAAVAVRSVSVFSLLFLPMLAVAFSRRRFWCRNLCPVGLISESCGKLRRARPSAPSSGWPPGRYLALATFGGALLGYPIFLWMDPLALFGGFFSLTRLGRAEITILSAAGLPLVMLVSVFFPGTWCARLCPLGATQDLLALAARFRFPRNVSRQRPAFLDRRAVLSLGAGTLFSALAPKSWAFHPRPLRPPGAVEETAFQGGCIRCGSCSRVCPTGIIQPALTEDGAAGLLAPRLRFSGKDYCLQDCNRCGQVCPTGVIRPLALAEKNRHVIGIAVVDLTDCYLTLERECGVCVARCPRQAIVDTFVYETYTTSVKVLAGQCNGCGACVGICPPKVIRVAPAARTSRS